MNYIFCNSSLFTTMENFTLDFSKNNFTADTFDPLIQLVQDKLERLPKIQSDFLASPLQKRKIRNLTDVLSAVVILTTMVLLISGAVKGDALPLVIILAFLLLADTFKVVQSDGVQARLRKLTDDIIGQCRNELISIKNVLAALKKFIEKPSKDNFSICLIARIELVGCQVILPKKETIFSVLIDKVPRSELAGLETALERLRKNEADQKLDHQRSDDWTEIDNYLELPNQVKIDHLEVCGRKIPRQSPF